MLYIIDTCTHPAWNLAAEEYLLKAFHEPVFRLWQNENAIIVGQYQNTLAEIDVKYVKENGITVVRRLTGGGAVFHDLGNVNFTFIEDRTPGEDTGTMFKRFTQPILEALNSLGVKAYLEGRNDLLIDGKKFSGNALCIHKNRILQHGTLLFSASMTDLSGALRSRPEKFIGKAVQSNRSRVTNISEHLPKTTPAAASAILSGASPASMDVATFREYIGKYICDNYAGAIVPYHYTEEDIRAINRLRDDKYTLDSWNFGKSPSYSYSKVAKLTGGMVEVYLSSEKGIITALKIFGDYFFTLPTEAFIDKIIGTPHTREAIMQKLTDIDCAVKNSGNPLGLKGYFSNTEPEELADLFFS